MLEVAPTAGHFLMEEGSHLGQLVLLASLCGWTAQRLVGLSLNIWGLRIFCGLAGVEAGSWFSQSLSWQPGPTVADFSLVASLAGAVVLVGFFKLLEVALDARPQVL